MFQKLTAPVRFGKTLFTYARIRRVEERPPAPPAVIVFFHVCLIIFPLISLFFVPFTWRALGALLLMNIIGIIGSEVADHRYFSHRSFKTSKWFEGFLGLCSGLVFQDSAFHWATDHVFHHRYTDQTGGVPRP